MSAVLGVVKRVECDAQGVPLDWERCRTCKGGTVFVKGTSVGLSTAPKCPTCGDHGSLRAAALAHLLRERGRSEHRIDVEPVYSEHGASLASAYCSCGWESAVGDEGDARDAAVTHREHAPHPAYGVARCEGCGHPMSDGTWEGADGRAMSGPPGTFPGVPMNCLRAGEEPPASVPTLWSPCDEGCRHDGPRRSRRADDEPWHDATEAYADAGRALIGNGTAVEASWRQVDVRFRNGWAHDLRPENLLLLCTRCEAAR